MADHSENENSQNDTYDSAKLHRNIAFFKSRAFKDGYLFKDDC